LRVKEVLIEGKGHCGCTASETLTSRDQEQEKQERTWGELGDRTREGVPKERGKKECDPLTLKKEDASTKRDVTNLSFIVDEKGKGKKNRTFYYRALRQRGLKKRGRNRRKKSRKKKQKASLGGKKMR